MIDRLVLPLVVLFAIGPVRGDEPDLPGKERFHLFVLAGQSNMAGRGRVAEEDRRAHPRVRVLDAEGRWRPAVDPLHFDKPRIAGVGPGRTFGEVLAEADPEVTIGLVPCAVGGSSIVAWKPKGYHDQTKSHPWDDCAKRVKRAMKDGTLKGVLWCQGESDSNAKRAGGYGERLREVVARFRTEFDAPRLPFLIGQMGRFPDRPWNDERRTVDAAHRELARTDDRAAFVSSDGLKHKGDKAHFDAASCREAGRRYAKAYRDLVE